MIIISTINYNNDTVRNNINNNTNNSKSFYLWTLYENRALEQCHILLIVF